MLSKSLKTLGFGALKHAVFGASKAKLSNAQNEVLLASILMFTKLKVS
jgi:hypothetical protein